MALLCLGSLRKTKGTGPQNSFRRSVCLFFIIFTVHFKRFLHTFQYLRILAEGTAHLQLIEWLVLIADAVFHGSPQVHGDGAELDLHGIIIHTVHVIGGDTDDHVETAVSVWLRRGYVILFPDDDQVGLFLQGIYKVADILFKVTDDADAGNVFEQRLGILHALLRALSLQLVLDALLLLDPVRDAVDRFKIFRLIGVMIQDLQPGEDQVHGVSIWFDQFIIFLKCHLLSYSLQHSENSLGGECDDSVYRILFFYKVTVCNHIEVAVHTVLRNRKMLLDPILFSGKAWYKMLKNKCGGFLQSAETEKGYLWKKIIFCCIW